MASRRKTGVPKDNIYRFVTWVVPKRRSSHGYLNIESDMMALPKSGTPVDMMSYIKARAAKQSDCDIDEVVIKTIDIFPGVLSE